MAGLRADWLMADQLFPVCSPALLAATSRCGGRRTSRTTCCFTQAPAMTTTGGFGSRRRLPTNLSKQPGVTFDLVFMTVQAAIDGIGVAMGRPPIRGRIARPAGVPFDITLPADAGFLPGLARGQGRHPQAVGISALAKRLDPWQTGRTWQTEPLAELKPPTRRRGLISVQQ